MKGFIKFLLAIMLLVCVAGVVALYSYNMIYKPDADRTDPSIPKFQEEKEKGEVIKKEETLTPLQKAYLDKNKVNFLLMGMDGNESETMMVIHFDREKKKVSVISVPSHTYYYQKGYESAADRKIGGAFKRQGIIGAMNGISEIFRGMPIHKYVRIDYKGVENIVDALGGIEIDVPFAMNYDDTTQGKELHIHLKKGKQTLKGKQAMAYLRYQNDNPKEDGSVKSGYKNPAMGRIDAQKKFIMAVAKKSLSLNFPKVAEEAFGSVKTDISLKDFLDYAKDGANLSPNSIETMLLPGGETVKNLDVQEKYYEANTAEIQQLIEKLYGLKK